MTRRIMKKMATQGENPPFSLEYILYLVSRVYGVAVSARASGYRKGLALTKKLPCKVISIGNLTTGGTGKTPMALYVSRLVEKSGWKVAVVSRGYKGGAEKNGGVVSDGKTMLMGPEEAGDEPYMMAQELETIPVIVGQNRYKSGMLAIETFGSNVIVLDDGFQHMQLARDLNLVLLDSRHPFGNSYLLPRGTLREPVSALSRADAFVMTRWAPEYAGGFKPVRPWIKSQPVFKSWHKPLLCKILKDGNVLTEEDLRQSGRYCLDALKRYRVLAFSGIARNEVFFDMLEQLGCNVVDSRDFPDHHPYTAEELDSLYEAVKAYRCDMAITTTKDFVRISQRIKWPIALLAMGIETDFGREREAFEKFIADSLKV